MIGKFFKYLAMGIVGIIVIGLGLTALGIALSLAAFAIKVGVIVLIGYGVVRLLGVGRKKTPEISEADRKWLES